MTSLLPTAYSIMRREHDTVAEVKHDKCVARSTIGRRAGQQHRHVLVYGITQRTGLRKISAGQKYAHTSYRYEYVQ